MRIGWLYTIRQKLRQLFELIASDQVKRTILLGVPFWIASLLTGLIAVGYTLLFGLAESGMQHIFHLHPASLFIIAPLCFFLAYQLIQWIAPNARGSGIPQVMAAIELASPKNDHKVRKLLSLRIVFAKIISSLVMVFGGGAIGREGPTIQIAGSIFRIADKAIPASWPKLSKQSFLLTGAAAGLAAAFNTPLGGVVFAMEELAKIHLRFFRTALFSAVIIAGLTAQGLLGPYLYLGYPDVQNLKFILFFWVAATAIIAGLAGALMSKATLRVLRMKQSFNKTKTLVFILAVGLVVAAIAYFLNPDMLGSGKNVMTSVLFSDDKTLSWHTSLVRMLGPVLAFNTGAAGGVFAPSLAAGASVGAFISGLLHFAGSQANILVLSGMVGFLTGVTRTPFTSAILVLEMTDRHSVIFHLMLAGILANFVALLIDKNSFYEQLKKNFM